MYSEDHNGFLGAEGFADNRILLYHCQGDQKPIKFSGATNVPPLCAAFGCEQNVLCRLHLPDHAAAQLHGTQNAEEAQEKDGRQAGTLSD